MKQSNTHSCRNKRQRAANQSSLLNATIDLTLDDSISNGSTSSNGSRNTSSRSSSSTGEVINLCGEPGTRVLEIEEDDDLPVPPKMPVFEKPKQQPSCPICFIEFVDAESVVTTACGHLFCKKCLLSSLKIRNVCPLCRQKVVKSKLIVVYFNVH